MGLAITIEVGQGLLIAHRTLLLFAKGLEAYPNYGMLCGHGKRATTRVKTSSPSIKTNQCKEAA
jgi:hypothetical protein